MLKGGEGNGNMENYRWYNNGIENIYITTDTPVPEGFYPGRLKGKNNFNLDNNETIWINNGVIQKHIKKYERNLYSDEWVNGMLERPEEWRQKVILTLKTKVSRENAILGTKKWHLEHPHATNSGTFKNGVKPHNIGKVAINNGSIIKYINKDELDKYLCDGWVKGVSEVKEKRKHK